MNAGQNAAGKAIDEAMDEGVEFADGNQTLFQKLTKCFSGDLRIMAYGIIQEAAESSRNPDNQFLLLPQYVASMEIRPDLSFNTRFMAFSVKPRAYVDYSTKRQETPQSENNMSGIFVLCSRVQQR